MRYLYFQPKSAPSTIKKWSSLHHHSILLLLQSCSKKEELVQIHANMIRTGLVEDVFLASRIIAFLTLPPPCSCSMGYARRVFDQIHSPNLFIWNSMIRGHTHDDNVRDALIIYKLMLRKGFAPDSYTYSIVSKACARLEGLEMGEMVHGMVKKCGFSSDMYAMSGLISLYASHGRMEEARVLFDEMPERDVVSWTSLLSGYAHLDQWDEVLYLFDEMRRVGIQPNKVTILNLLSACIQLCALDRGRWLHSHILDSKEIEIDIDIANSLVKMYAICGAKSSAVEVFNKMPVINTSTWNSLIGGLVNSAFYGDALAMFQEMMQSDESPDDITIVSALSACAQLDDLSQGKLIHTYILDRMITSDIFVGNALVNMYAKCGDLPKAESIFLEMPKRDVFSWSAMISGYVQGDFFVEALALFEKMLASHVEPNEVTLVSVLSACSHLGLLDRGQQVHSYIEGNKVKKDVSLMNALIDLYAKCGCIDVASLLFHGMLQRDTHSWNTMIGGLATHGHGREAIELFSQMQRTGDSKPDNVTLMAVLCACSHAGMVREGLCYFNSMLSLYGIAPEIEHYGCIVDLLGRAGLIYEALDFIKKMPIAPNSVIWGSVLAACRVHGKTELGERIAELMIKLAPYDEGAQIIISNLYAESGRWDDVRRVRTGMQNMKVEKSPGCSSIEVNGFVHEFFIGDKLHHQTDMIYLVINSLTLQLKQTAWESSIDVNLQVYDWIKF